MSVCKVVARYGPQGETFEFAVCARMDLNGQGMPIKMTTTRQDAGGKPPHVMVEIRKDLLQCAGLRFSANVTCPTKDLMFITIAEKNSRHDIRTNFFNVGGPDGVEWNFCGNVHRKNVNLIDTTWHIYCSATLLFTLGLKTCDNQDMAACVNPGVTHLSNPRDKELGDHLLNAEAAEWVSSRTRAKKS